MTSSIDTLIIVADGTGARGFAERARHGELSELADWSQAAPEDARHAASGPRSTGVTRHGSSRHAVHDVPPADAAERQFLTRLGERIEREAKGQRFERLVLMAPPRALGVLRAALGPVARQKLEISEPHERIKDTAEALRRRLRELRVPA